MSVFFVTIIWFILKTFQTSGSDYPQLSPEIVGVSDVSTLNGGTPPPWWKPIFCCFLRKPIFCRCLGYPNFEKHKKTLWTIGIYLRFVEILLRDASQSILWHISSWLYLAESGFRCSKIGFQKVESRWTVLWMVANSCTREGNSWDSYKLCKWRDHKWDKHGYPLVN